MVVFGHVVAYCAAPSQMSTVTVVVCVCEEVESAFLVDYDAVVAVTVLSLEG